MTFITLGSVILLGLVQLIPIALVLALAVCISGLSLTRGHGIRLYWVVGFLSLITLPAIPMLIGMPVLFEQRGDGVCLPLYQLASWPSLACLAGSFIALGLAYARSELARAMSGCSWGMTAMFACRIALALQ